MRSMLYCTGGFCDSLRHTEGVCPGGVMNIVIENGLLLFSYPDRTTVRNDGKISAPGIVNVLQHSLACERVCVTAVEGDDRGSSRNNGKINDVRKAVIT